MTPNEWKELQSNALGSGTAGIFGRLICHPIDTIKSRLQSQEYCNTSTTLSLFRKTFQEEGFKGLYRGFGVVVIGGVPGTCIYFTTYEFAKKKLMDSEIGQRLSPFACYFMSGIIAETACCAVFVPVDVIKERLQVQNVHMSKEQVYSGSLNAALQIYKYEGISGIYKGYGATILSYSPFSALYFLLYEDFKIRFTRRQSDISFTELVYCSALAGAIASYITSPLDMAKLRLQIINTHSAKRSAVKITLRSILVDVYKSEGIKGLFRGANARVIFHTPSTAITMAFFEECKRLWASVLC